MARRNQSKKARTTEFNQPVRNPVAANPLLGKSQAHGKTRKAKRRADKVSLRKMPFDRATGSVFVAVQVVGSSGIVRSKAPSVWLAPASASTQAANRHSMAA